MLAKYVNEHFVSLRICATIINKKIVICNLDVWKYKMAVFIKHLSGFEVYMAY